MWGDRKRKKSKLEGKVVIEIALRSGIFFSKFRCKPNSIFLQLNKKYTNTAQSQTPKGMLMFHNAPHKGKSFQSRARALDKPVSRLRFSHWKIYVWKEFVVISCNHQKGTVGLLTD